MFSLFLLPLPSLAAAPTRPNVILLLVDDVGYGDFSCLGSPLCKTPNIDRLHDQSVRLTDFHVTPMCTPTRGELLTGVDALANGAMNVSSGRSMLRAGIPTLADLFSAAGYRTAMFGKWHLGDVYPYRPQDRGFQTALWFPSSHISSAPDHWNNDYFDPFLRQADGTEKQFKGYCTDVFFSQAMSWLTDRAKSHDPFFLYLPLNAAHAPWYAPDHYRDPYRVLPHNLASFYAMIANIDDNVGRLSAFLTKTSLADNTLLIFLTDNGGTVGVPTFNAGMKGTKVTLWEGGHRVPCFLRPPTTHPQLLGPPRDVPALTEVQDLLPTLSDLCHLPSSPHSSFILQPSSFFTGTSLLPLLQNDTPLRDRMLVVQFSRINHAVPPKGAAAVLWNHWRLLHGTDLYDVSADPHQDHNVAADHPDVVAKMRAHYDRWWAAVSPTVNTPCPITIGDPHEPATLLSPADWFNVFLDQQLQVRAAPPHNGPWSLDVARPGTYTFELRRYPREADLPLTAPAPQAKLVDGSMPPAKPLPIAKATLRVGTQTLSSPIAPNAKSITFTLPLTPGPTTAQSTFLDKDDHELCGAYYVYVSRTEHD